MLKTGILHPQLARVLAELRHKDTIIIGDAGLPIPKGVERVDLGWRPGDPAYLDVLEEILPISARLISNKASYKFKNNEIMEICDKINAICGERGNDR